MDWSSSGFRMPIELPDLKDNKKVFIFIDLKWTKIKNIQDHVKSIFNINEDVKIFVDDVLLPENETIKLIQPEDTLMIRIQHKKKEKRDPGISKWDETTEDVISLDSNKKSKLKRKKDVDMIEEDTDEQLISVCLEELRTKREQFSKGDHIDMNSVSSPTDSPGTKSLFSIPSLKKRKRKHKKKSKVKLNECIEESISNKCDLLSFASLESKHIQFSDEDDEELSATSLPTVKENDAEKCKTKLSSLLELVNKPTSEKVFTRKNDVLDNTVVETKVINPITSSANKLDEKRTNSEGELVHSGLTVPKVGDLISFKKMKLGWNYTPEISNEIVGEVLTVEDSSGLLLVVFNIKGAEEFEEPSGKFSMEVVKEDSNPNENHVVKIPWSDVLEPRTINGTLNIIQ